MIPIDPARLGTAGTGRVRGAGTAASSGTPSAAGGFRVAAEAGGGTAESAVPVGDAMPVSLGVMLAAEALDRDVGHDRAARRHGLVVLAGLTALQRALLEGGDPAASLDRLGALLDDMPRAVDPRLAALLDAVVLRVRVELARLDASAGRSGNP